MSATAVFNSLDTNGDGVLSREEFTGAVQMPGVTYAAAPGAYAAMPTTYTVRQVVAEPGTAGAVAHAAAPTISYLAGASPAQAMSAGPATTTTAAPVYVQAQPTVQYSVGAEQTGVAQHITGGEQAGAVTYAALQEQGAVASYAQAPTVTYLPAGAEAGAVTSVQQAEAGSVSAFPAGVPYGLHGSVAAAQYVAGAPAVTYVQPGAMTYQRVPGAAQPVMGGVVTYEGAAPLPGDGSVPGQAVVPRYVAQQMPSIPSFVAAPGSVTYGLSAAQASIPQGSIAYAQPGLVAGSGVLHMQGYPAEPGAFIANSPPMAAYPGPPGSMTMQQPGVATAAAAGAVAGAGVVGAVPAADAAPGQATSARAGSKKKEQLSKKKKLASSKKKKSKSCC